MDTMESRVVDLDTWIPDTWWGTHTWWGAYIHGGELTYMVAWQLWWGLRLGFQTARPLAPNLATHQSWPSHHLCGLPTMYVGLYGFPTR